MNHFLSCSGNTVKLWSTPSSLQDHSSRPAVLSTDSLHFARRITSCAFMSDHNLSAALSDGDPHVFDLHHKRLLKSYSIDKEVDGPITAIRCFQHLIYVLTQHNAVYCFDLRISPASTSRNPIVLEPVWRRRARNSYGLATSFCMDEANQHWLFLTASSATTKNLILWDLRFSGLEVASWSHPSDRIIPLKSWPRVRGSQSSEVFTNCSREAEVSLWDLSSQSRTDVLWPSGEELLVYKQECVTTALTPSCIDTDLIYTGDSEGSLRCWNLKRTERSSYLSGPYGRQLSSAVVGGDGAPSSTSTDTDKTPRIRYKQIRFRDNLLRIHAEDRQQVARLAERSQQRLIRPTEHHIDAVTDMLSIWPDMLVSSDREGVIKIWRTY